MTRKTSSTPKQRQDDKEDIIVGLFGYAMRISEPGQTYFAPLPIDWFENAKSSGLENFYRTFPSFTIPSMETSDSHIATAYLGSLTNSQEHSVACLITDCLSRGEDSLQRAIEELARINAERNGVPIFLFAPYERRKMNALRRMCNQWNGVICMDPQWRKREKAARAPEELIF